MIRDTITGIHTREQIARLTWPIAWSGTTPAETRAVEEAAISDLAAEAREALDADPDAMAVEIVDGKIVATVRVAEEG